MIKAFYDQAIAAANVRRFRPPVIPGHTPAARPGEPGHHERLISAPPVGIWPLTDRGRDLTR